MLLDLGVDTGTPVGELVAHITAAVAQYERRLIGLRTREALAVKRAQGVRLGRPPAVPVWVRERIAAERTAGAAWAKIAPALNCDGVPTGHGAACWHPATVRYVGRKSLAPC